jgi:putative ABC transport system permease protein
MKLSTIALRNLSRNRRRSLLSAVAIAVAAMAISLLFALLAGYSGDIAYNLQSYYTGEVRIRNAEYERYDYLNPLHLSISEAPALVAELEGMPEVAAVSPRIPFPATLFQGDDRVSMSGLGVDMARDRDFQDLEEILLAGRLPETGAREALLAAGLAERLDMGLGDTLTVLTATKYRGTNAMSFEVVGVVGYPVAGLNVSRLLVPLEAAARLTRMENEVTEILIKTTPEADARQLVARLGGVLPPGLLAQPWHEINASYEIVQSAQAAYNIIGLVFILLGSTVVINTTMMVIFERLREIGTLAALGMNGRRLVRLFLLEAVFLSSIGAVAGVSLGTLIAWPLSVVGINLGPAMEGVSFEMSAIIRPEVTLMSTVVVLLGTIGLASLASLTVARRVAGIDPVEALAAP